MMIPLPATASEVLTEVINPSLELLATSMCSDEARVMLLAIAGQESGLAAREQIGGTARGLWQFERNGVIAVMTHPRTCDAVPVLCQKLDVPFGSSSIYNALATNDELACGMARLLLWADSQPLPALEDADGAWSCYVRNWKPGKPAPQRWGLHYINALNAVETRA